MTHIMNNKYTETRHFDFEVLAKIWAWYKRRRGFKTMVLSLEGHLGGAPLWRVYYLEKKYAHYEEGAS